MKQNSLALGFLILIGIIAINLMVFGVSYSSEFSRFLFLGIILFGAFAFSFAKINSNSSSIFLQIAFYFNLFLISLEMLYGARNLLIALSCIASIAGMLYAISRISPRIKRKPTFPMINSQVDSYLEKPLESKKEKVDKQLGDYEFDDAKVEPYSSEDKDEISTILKEIESKAKELNLEIKNATSSTSLLKSESEDKEVKKPIEKRKSQKKKAEISYTGKVYAGKNSNFYHSEDCPVVKRLLKRKEFETTQRAEFAGLKPHDCVKNKK
ncbi:MAG TPA: hypothetical protein PLX15_03690 [Candidatus Woesearchaeota archaeon]|mgnify:CR=1 FL=1|nr:hypothetical protein [Candidatus Woesearchaeota archaeon]